MKKLAIASVLLVLAVTVAVWSGAVFSREMNALSSSLERLLEVSKGGDTEAVSLELQNVFSVWEKASNVLHALVMHESVTELEQSINVLPDILEHGETEEFRLKCIEALSQIKNLVGAEKLSWENILKIR